MSTSIYRVGTANQYDSAMRNITQRHSELTDLQENLTSGKRVVKPSDDPVAAAQAERALTRISRIQTEQRALDLQRNSIAQAESTLGQAVSLGQEMREILVNAGNGIHTPKDRQTLANQLQSLRDQMFELTSRKDANGQPLFAALGSGLSPLLGPQSSGLDYEFDGLPGQVAANGTNIPIALDGDAAFTFKSARDGVYHAAFQASTLTELAPGAATGSTPSVTPNRKIGTSTIEVVDRALVTGDSYDITFSAVGPGATAGTLTATYTVTDSAGATINTVTLPDFPADKPLSVEVLDIPGVKFTIDATPTKAVDGTITLAPADGDTFSLQPQNSIFGVIDTAIAELKGATDNNAAIQASAQALGNLDKSMERLHIVRGYAGELLNRADRIMGDQEDRSIQLEADRSRAEDLDMISGISKFQGLQTGYEAALKSYSMVQKTSLFNYMA
ncbi:MULTISPECIES: flagellar hook-associated protein FlgL [Giesbergeria]|uniref:Flagellar hook-associated protein FlgL n=1 Tax=Giesbergeria sinuosa TaxID=80883 RepID=A0ABV9Q899_9BURK